MDAISKPSPDPDEFRRWYERELDLWTRVTLSGLVINGKMKERGERDGREHSEFPKVTA